MNVFAIWCSIRLGIHAALFVNAAVVAAPFGPAPMGAGFRKALKFENRIQNTVAFEL
jgi:hypothetical protein